MGPVQGGPCEHDSWGKRLLRMQGVFPEGLHRKRGMGDRTPKVSQSSSFIGGSELNYSPPPPHKRIHLALAPAFPGCVLSSLHSPIPGP